MIRLEKDNKYFGDLHVLKDVSLAVPEGEKLEMDEDIARRTMARVDKARAGYHRIYGGGDVPVNCHVMFHSAEFGIEGCAVLLEGIARQKFHL